MAKYAKGKHAVLIDDRSGFKIKYKMLVQSGQDLEFIRVTGNQSNLS